jgi:nucleotide-binding universal stress UspA family protein
MLRPRLKSSTNHIAIMKPKNPARRIRPRLASAPAVICGTDFSPAAGHAADGAAALARAMKAPLGVAHASAIPVDPGATAALEAEVARLRRQGTEVHEIWRVGRPAEELVKLASPESCRLLVVGPRGLGGSKSYGFGSTSGRSAERARVPTLVVRDAAPFAAWANGERPLRLLVAYDFSASGDAALGWVRELCQAGQCVVTIGSVEWPPVGRAQMVVSRRSDPAAGGSDLRSTLQQELKSRVGRLLRSAAFKICVEVNGGPAAVWLMEMARREQADLVVLGTHQYRGLERLWRTSVSRTVLNRSRLSVVVVPAKGGGQPTLTALTIHRVLAATDFSDLANRAVLQAYALAAGRGEVFLVHVIHPGALPNGEFQQGPGDRQTAARHARCLRQCERKLRALMPKGASRLGIVTTIEVVEDRETAAAIAKAAERLGVDVICIGTHGRSGLSRMLLGSVAQDLVRHSTLPLLLTRAPRA